MRRPWLVKVEDPTGRGRELYIQEDGSLGDKPALVPERFAILTADRYNQLGLPQAYALSGPAPEPLRVVEHINGGVFGDDNDTVPDYEDDQHVFYPALAAGEEVEGTSHEEFAGCEEFQPYTNNFFILSRPEPDARERLEAIKRYFKES